MIPTTPCTFKVPNELLERIAALKKREPNSFPSTIQVLRIALDELLTRKEREARTK